MMDGQKVSRLFTLSQKPLNFFQKIILFFFKEFLTTSTLLPSSWELLYYANHEEDLLRYLFMAEISRPGPVFVSNSGNK